MQCNLLLTKFYSKKILKSPFLHDGNRDLTISLSASPIKLDFVPTLIPFCLPKRSQKCIDALTLTFGNLMTD